jgi:hypothetical protein
MSLQHSCFDLGGIKRFEDNPLCTRSHCPPAFGKDGRHEHGNAGCHRICLKRCQNIPPVEAGHQNIEEYRHGLNRPGNLHGRLRRIRADWQVVLTSEKPLGNFQKLPVVIHNQQPGPRPSGICTGTALYRRFRGGVLSFLTAADQLAYDMPECRQRSQGAASRWYAKRPPLPPTLLEVVKYGLQGGANPQLSG